MLSLVKPYCNPDYDHLRITFEGENLQNLISSHEFATPNFILLKFEIDFNYFGWSEFDILEFGFEDEELHTARIQDFEDVLSVRTGLSYSLTEQIDLRGGYYYDPTPQPTKAMSPLLADSDRHGVSLGFGFDMDTWVIDVFGLLLIAGERDSEMTSLDGFNGTYQSEGVLFGANAGFNF